MPTIEEFESLVTKEVAKRTELIHFVLWSRNRQTTEELELMGDFTLIVLEVLAKNFPTLVYDSGYVRLARHSLPSYLAVLDAAKGLLRIHMEMTEPGFDARKVPPEVEARRARPISMPPLAGNKTPAIRRVPSGTPQAIQHSKTADSISALRSIETNVDRPTAGASRTPTSRTPTTVVSTPASTPALTPTPAERTLLPRTSSYEWTRSKSNTPPELIKRRSSPPAPAANSRSPPVEAPRQRTASTAAEAPRQRTSSTAAESPRERQRTSSTANGTPATTPTSTSRKSSPPVALLSDPRVANALPRPQRSPFRMQLPAGAMPPREITYSKPLADVGTPPKVGTPPTPTTPGVVPCPTMPWGSQLSLAGSPKTTPSPQFMAKPVPASPPSRPSSLLMPDRPASILLPSRPNSMISPCVTRLPAETLALPSSHSRDPSSLSNMLEAKAPEKKVKWRFPWAGSSDSSHKFAPEKKTYEKKAYEKAYDKTAGGKTPKKETSLLSRSRLASDTFMDRKSPDCNCGGVHY